MDFDDWWRVNAGRIHAERTHGYAELFACEVLQRIPGVDFAHVSPERTIGDYRADFVISEGETVRLAIEVDSTKHHWGDAKDHVQDAEKTQALERAGRRVLRVPNGQFGRWVGDGIPPEPIPGGIAKAVAYIGDTLATYRKFEAESNRQPKLQGELRQLNESLDRANAQIADLTAAAEANAADEARDVTRIGSVPDLEGERMTATQLVQYEPALAPALQKRDALAADRIEIIQDIMAAVLTYDERRRHEEAEERHRQDLRELAAIAVFHYQAVNARMDELEGHRRAPSRTIVFGGIAAAVLALVAVAAVLLFVTRGDGATGDVALELAALTSPIKAGDKASITVVSPGGQACGLTYLTPNGSRSNANGLDTKVPAGDGNVSWSWLVGSGTKAGTGRVRIDCGSNHQEWPIEITE